MASPKSKGRMIRKDISISERFACLSKDSQVLFCMIIPHLNSHGKLNGNPEFIKGEIAPLIEWLRLEEIPKYLKEISEKTNLKWFQLGRLYYLHSLSWKDHQDLEANKRGVDNLPSYPQALVDDYSPTSREPVAHEVKDQVKVELKDETKDQVKGQALTFFNDGLKPSEEDAIRAELGKSLHHKPDSEANRQAYKELVAKIADKKGIKNKAGYLRRAAQNLGKESTPFDGRPDVVKSRYDKQVKTGQIGSEGLRQGDNSRVSEAPGRTGQAYGRATGDRPADRGTESAEEVNPTDRLISDPDAEAARLRLKKKTTGLKSGVDPTAAADLAIIGGYHLESGIRSFLEWKNS